MSRSGNHSQIRRTGRRLLLPACLLAVLLIPAAQATPGALDPSFGTGGKVTTALGLTKPRAGKMLAGGAKVKLEVSKGKK